MIETFLERKDDTIWVQIEYVYYPGIKGAVGSCGEPIQPSEGPMVQIESVVDEGGNEVTLNNREKQKVEEEILAEENEDL